MLQDAICCEICRVFLSLFLAKSHYLGWLVGRLFRDLLIIIWRRAVICIQRPSASLEPHWLHSLRKIHVWCGPRRLELWWIIILYHSTLGAWHGEHSGTPGSCYQVNPDVAALHGCPQQIPKSDLISSIQNNTTG